MGSSLKFWSTIAIAGDAFGKSAGASVVQAQIGHRPEVDPQLEGEVHQLLRGCCLLHKWLHQSVLQ
jgi:hypothetical protein